MKIKYWDYDSQLDIYFRKKTRLDLSNCMCVWQRKVAAEHFFKGDRRFYIQVILFFATLRKIFTKIRASIRESGEPETFLFTVIHILLGTKSFVIFSWILATSFRKTIARAVISTVELLIGETNFFIFFHEYGYFVEKFSLFHIAESCNSSSVVRPQ